MIFHYNFSILKDTTSLFNEVADNMVNKLRDYADGETMVSMVDFLSRVTMDAIGKVSNFLSLIAVLQLCFTTAILSFFIFFFFFFFFSLTFLLNFRT